MDSKGNFIDGAWILPNGDPFNTTCPATAQNIWSGIESNEQSVVNAIISSRRAFSSWSNLSVKERFSYLEKFKLILVKEKDRVTNAIAIDTGKPIWEAATEVSAMISKFDLTWDAYHERCLRKPVSLPDATSLVRSKPHGVIVVIGPFNFPGHIPNGHILPALLAGNTVIYKPSEYTPYSSEIIFELWESAGLPSGVLNLCQGKNRVGKLLVEHSQIDGIFFTGSTKAGLAINESIYKYPHRIIALEMGGNNPLVISKSKNIDAAVYNTVLSAFITSGQRCTCARRLIVIENDQTDEFINRLVQVSKNITAGVYNDEPQPFIGSLISNKSASDVLNSFSELQSLGGNVLLPPQRKNEYSAIITPGIIEVSNIEAQDSEIFGPILKVIKVKNLETAVSVANDTAYGLSSGIISDSEDEFKYFYSHTRAGLINWNRPLTNAASSAPFGGVGKSGNHHPSAYYAADYCAYPVASLISNIATLPEQTLPGINFEF